MRPELTPTLWRTCRALANERRLRILALLHAEPDLAVSQVAKTMDCPASEISESLRILNARGLLRVTRRNRHVYYRVGSDPSIPWTKPLLRAVLRVLTTDSDGATRVFRAATALTHPRRQSILAALRLADMNLNELQHSTAISKPALKRHLRKLRSRGFIAYRHRRYSLIRSRDALHQTLLDLASQALRQGITLR